MSSTIQTLPPLDLIRRMLPQNRWFIGVLFLVNITLLILLVLFSPGSNFQALKSEGVSPFKLVLAMLVLFGVLFEFGIRISNAKIANYFPFSFAVALAGFSWIYFPRLPRLVLYPDSFSYIGNDTTRGFIYPKFIDLLIPESIQNLPSVHTAADYLALSAHYSLVAYTQWALFLGVSFLFMHMLYKRYFLGPVLFFGLVAGHQFFFPNAFLTGNVSAHLSFVLTEGLGYSWVVGLAYISFKFASKPNLSFLHAIFLGLYCYLGIEIAPRMVPFSAVGVVIPGFVSLFHSTWKDKLRSLVPVMFFAGFILLRCSYNLAHFNVFAPTPFGGQSLSAIAIQFANPDDYQLVKEPLAKEYTYRILHHPQRSTEAIRNLFINRNIYGIGFNTYKEMAKENGWKEDTAAYNAFIAPIITTIFYKNPEAIKRWWIWLSTQLTDLWNARAYFTPVHLLSLLLSVILIFLSRGKNKILLAAPLLLLLPFASLCLTAGIQGVDFRYLSTGELIFPVVLATMIVELIRMILDWDGVKSK